MCSFFEGRIVCDVEDDFTERPYRPSLASIQAIWRDQTKHGNFPAAARLQSRVFF